MRIPIEVMSAIVSVALVYGCCAVPGYTDHGHSFKGAVLDATTKTPLEDVQVQLSNPVFRPYGETLAVDSRDSSEERIMCQSTTDDAGEFFMVAHDGYCEPIFLLPPCGMCMPGSCTVPVKLACLIFAKDGYSPQRWQISCETKADSALWQRLDDLCAGGDSDFQPRCPIVRLSRFELEYQLPPVFLERKLK